MNDMKGIVILGIALALMLGGGLWILFGSPDKTEQVESTQRQNDETITSPTSTNKEQQFQQAFDITTPDGYINTNGEELYIKDLLGKKVVLINFWTYSCINCKRTLGHFNDWYDEYQDQGLEIIGIHTPEFSFEHKYKNVENAVIDEEIKYPVVLDNDYSTWRSYKNRYWPRRYLIDIDGYIVYDHIGEGAYEETKSLIEKTLAERAARGI